MLEKKAIKGQMTLKLETSRKLNVLHKHITKLAGINKLNEVYLISFSLLNNLYPSSDICIGLVEGDLIRVTCTKNDSDNVTALSKDGKGIMVRAWRKKTTQIVNDTRLDPEYVPVGLFTHLSETAVPVIFNEEVIAVINIKDPRANGFTEDDKQIVEILSEYISSIMLRISQSMKVSTTESTYRTMIENSNDAILVVSNSKIVYVNNVTTKLCGYEQSKELVGKNAVDFISQQYRDQFGERIKRRVAGEPQPERFDHEILRKDGSIVQVETTASMINYDGKQSVLFVGRDITERKKFEAKLFALHQYAAQLGAAQTLVEVSEPTLKTISSVMGYEYANFMVREGDNLGCIDDNGFGSPYWNIPIDGKGCISRAACEKRTVLENDLSGSTEINGGQQGVRSELATPVILKGEIQAVISVESMQKDAFKESDVKILEIISYHVASALERIELG